MAGRRISKVQWLLAATAAVLLSAGCVKADVPSPKPPGEESAPLANRMDCGKIYGSAYHSPEERAWFETNCISWPAFRSADPPPGAAPSAADASCQSVAGRPYASDQERQWFLTNCVGRASAAPGSAGQAANSGPDRASCDEIRGTPYRSDAERAWYLRSCPTIQQPPQPVASNPPLPLNILSQQPFPPGR
jgi:hypothetical protein